MGRAWLGEGAAWQQNVSTGLSPELKAGLGLANTSAWALAAVWFVLQVQPCPQPPRAAEQNLSLPAWQARPVRARGAKRQGQKIGRDDKTDPK